MEEGGAGSAGWNGPAGSVVAEVEPGSLRSDNRREAQKARCGPEQQTGAISVGEGLSGGHSAAAASEYLRDDEREQVSKENSWKGEVDVTLRAERREKQRANDESPLVSPLKSSPTSQSSAAGAEALIVSLVAA